MDFDSAIIGVIVGSVLSLIGNIVNHWFSMRKEEKQWLRQQEAEDKKRKLDEEQQEINNIRNIYHNCISRLSLIEASKSKHLDIPAENLATIHKEAFEWLSLLSLHQRDLYDEKRHNFHKRFREFSDDPQFEAPFIFQEVYKLAMSDKVLFPNVKPKKYDPNQKRAQMNISEEFRRQQMIDSSINLPSTHMFDLDISKLSLTQREKLWDQNKKNIPDTIYLSLPKFNEQTNQIILKGEGIWTTSLNPYVSSIDEIFNKWEENYDKALEVAQKKADSVQQPS